VTRKRPWRMSVMARTGSLAMSERSKAKDDQRGLRIRDDYALCTS